ncbi:MAG: SGNH/GDSL hydrolase family protein [Balneolaceae bacterium]
MKLFKNISLGLLISAFLLVGCDDTYDSLVSSESERNPIPDTEVEASQGNADFTNYVAIGNSLTAGFMDGALYDNSQRFSLAAQLSAQFEFTGAPATFNQPDINSTNGFNTTANTGEAPILGRFKLDTNIPGPSPTLNGDPIQPYEGDAASLNNFGVPGIQVGQLLTPDTGTPETAAFNPFYARFASSPGSSTILGDAISTEPTFFTLWIGSNDLLGYALSGATNSAILTSQADFQERFGTVVNTLMENTQAKGVVANIPTLIAVPYFRAVPYNAVELDNPAEIAGLNQGLSSVNDALDAIVAFLGHDAEDAERRKISYESGNNPILIVDPNLEDLGPKFDQLQGAGAINADQRAALQPYVQSRPMEAGIPGIGSELVLLTAGQVLGTPADPDNPQSLIGVVVPLSPEYTLTAENIVELETARATYNAIIDGVVQQSNANETRIALFDTNGPESAFTEIFGLDGSQPGIQVDGTFLQPDFSPNGVFSSDGIHPNARGTGILANEFIRVIESEFDAVIPRADVLGLPGVSVCAGDCVSEQSGS